MIALNKSWLIFFALSFIYLVVPDVEDEDGPGDEPGHEVDHGHDGAEDIEAGADLGPEDAEEDDLEDDGEDVDHPGDHHGLDHAGLCQAPDQAEVEQDVDEQKSLKCRKMSEVRT